MYFGSLEGWVVKAKLDWVRVEPFVHVKTLVRLARM